MPKCLKWLKARTFNLILVVILLLGIAPDAASATAPEESREAIILLNTDSQEDLNQAADDVRSLGGVVLATFPNRAMYAQLSSSQLESITSHPQVQLVSYGPVESPESFDDTGAQAAVAAWNARFSEIEPEQLDPVQLPEIDDQRFPPEPEGKMSLAGAESLAPSIYQTSEFMIGSLQVDVFLPESNGMYDPNSEDWDVERVNSVMAKITNGVTWWIAAAQKAGPPVNLNANIVFHTPFNEPAVVSTGYEPVTRPYHEEGLWMGEILSRLGFPGPYFNAVRQYVNHRRMEMKKDWGFTIWVVDSQNDLDGSLSDGFFGYAYINGPMMVMTYDNSTWGIDRMDIVVAHEMGHIFGALDEYRSSGCNDSARSGYLYVANTNCENGDPATEESIMRSSISQLAAYPNHWISTPARGMVGWRDTDRDGIYDPVDTAPRVTWASAAADVELAGSYTISGETADVPYQSPFRSDITINTIKLVEYRIAGGTWLPCSPTDGRFDGKVEGFTCTILTLPEEGTRIEVRSENCLGNTSLLNLVSQGGIEVSYPYQAYLPLIGK